jgi:uncharacterized protein (DUF58 family)
MELQVNVLDFHTLVDIINKNVAKFLELFKLKIVYFKIVTGKGMEFDRLREYTDSDDASSIDWNATARTTKPYVKVFKEERMLDVVILFDTSNTMLLGTTPMTKNEYASVIAGILGYTAVNAGDKLGAIFFSDKVKFILDQSNSMDNFYSMVKLMTDKKNYSGIKDWSCMSKILLETFGPDTVLFIISDFMRTSPQMFNDLEKYANKFRAVFGIMVRDPRDSELPKGVGNIYLQDPDTGRISLVNVDKVRDKYNLLAKRQEEFIERIFRNAGSYFFKVHTNEDFVTAFINFFNKSVTEL